MSDPFAIFRNAPNRQATLKALWPELHACLAGTDKPAEPRPHYCVLGDCAGATKPAVAVARTDRYGHPACAKHLSAIPWARPGGWPLDLSEHKR